MTAEAATLAGGVDGVLSMVEVEKQVWLMLLEEQPAAMAQLKAEHIDDTVIVALLKRTRRPSTTTR